MFERAFPRHRVALSLCADTRKVRLRQQRSLATAGRCAGCWIGLERALEYANEISLSSARAAFQRRRGRSVRRRAGDMTNMEYEQHARDRREC